MAGCPPFDPSGQYVSSMLAYFDCQGLSLGEAGYRALGTGSPFGLALTGLLTIFVALIGYRLLLGGDFSIRETATTALKLGIVLALATQWSAYKIVIFDIAARQPERAAAGFLASEGLGGQGSAGLAARFDGVNAALAELIDRSASARKVQGAAMPSPLAQQPQSQHAPRSAPESSLPEPAEKGLDTAIGLLAATALTGFLAVRISLALLLALGPVFIASMLFDATRGFFVGWLRAVTGIALAAVAVPIVLAMQLSVLEPQVLALRASIEGSQPVAAMPQQILGTAVVFALALLVVAVIVIRAAAGFRLPEPFRRSLGEFGLTRPFAALPAPDWQLRGMSAMPDERSRAQLVADAAQALEARGERMRQAILPPQRLALPHGELAATLQSGPVEAPLPLGQQGRRSLRRHSPGATRRDELQ